MRVVLDANVITEKNWHLIGAAAESLLAAAGRGRLQLTVPELVVQEVVASHARSARKAERDLERALGRVRQLAVASERNQWSLERPLQQFDYNGWLRTRLMEHHVDIAPLPEVTAALVARALARRRPFDGDGKHGFRDAILWEVTYTDSMPTVLVSADGDFTDAGGGLHPDLVEDLVARGLPEDAVQLVRTLDEAAELVLGASRSALATVQELLADAVRGPEIAQRLRDLVSQSGYIDDSNVHVGLDTAGEPFEASIASWELVDLHVQDPVEASDAFPLDENSFAVHLHMPGDAFYDVEVSTDAFSRQPDRVPRDVRLSSDERTAYLGGHAPVLVEFDARLRGTELDRVRLLGLAGA